MPNPTLAPFRHLLVLSTLAVGLGACAKPPTTTPSDATDGTPTDEAVATVDPNFGCTLDGAELHPWTAEGLDLPEAIVASFELWATMDGDAPPPQLEAVCTNLPASGKYSPVKPAMAGGVSRGDIVVTTRDVTLYRAYTAADFECGTQKPAGEFGSWWSPLEPTLPKQSYREANAICPAWNDLTMIVSCTLPAGTVVLVGPTQSTTCVGSSTCDPAPEGWENDLPATEAPQLFINTYTAAGPRSPEELQAFRD